MSFCFNLIDNHFHYKKEGAGVAVNIDEAFNLGLLAAIEAGTNLEDIAERLTYVNSHKNLFATVGVHPEYATPQVIEQLPALNQYLSHPKVVAIGEIGLDYSYSTDKKLQQNLFAGQLQLAKANHKLIMLHIRDAHADTLAMVDEAGLTGGVVHCFSADVATAKAWLDRGFYLSFPGIITFKNGESCRQSAAYTPIDRLFCETDAPWLAPVPVRGKENSPIYVRYIYDELAKLKNMSLAQLAAAIKDNFESLYKVTL
ncbi:MAG: TatD family hydrolase [Spirochaetaceae bacterium]|nr:TatD family hydrolase [Spirochaetaceae bacterium]